LICERFLIAIVIAMENLEQGLIERGLDRSRADLSAQDLGLLKNCHNCPGLLVRGVVVFGQDTLDHHAHLCLHTLLDCPVNRGIFPDLVYQFMGDLLQDFIAKDHDRAVIDLKRFIECQLCFGEAETFTSLVSLPQFFCGSLMMFLRYPSIHVGVR
jgi:hypothetical protein